jgi:hypothetical protein
MAGTAVVGAGNYILEIDTGFIQDAFLLDANPEGVLAGYTTTTTRTNLVTNPNFETNTTGWGSAQSSKVRSTDYAYIGTASYKVTMSSIVDTNVGYVIPTFSGTGNATFSIYCYIPTGSTLAGRTISLSREGGTATQTAVSSSAATLVAGSWVRASITRNITVAGTMVLVCRLSGTLSTAVGQVVYLDSSLGEFASSALPYFDGTYAETYTGYTLTEQAWNGTADASTSTATWGLNSSYVGSLYVLNGTTNFADVTTGIDSITVRRGRRDIGDQFSAGTMTFNMLDTTGIFNPFDTLSPYYDPATAQPGLAPMRKVRLARYSSTNVKEDLFNGFIVNFDYNFALGGLDTVTVYCADDFYLLAQTFLAEFNVSEELSSVRLAAVLDLPEVDFPIGQRDISTGTQTLGGASAFTVAEGTNTLEYCNQINLAEQGRLFMARDGDITFQPRIGNTLSQPAASFHDDGTNVPYDSIGITFEADQVVNRAAVAIRGGTQEVAEDLASQAKYFIQTQSITDSLLHDDPAALTLANYLLEPEPEARYTSLGTNLNKLTTAQRDTVAIIDIGDTISIEKSFASGGTGTTQLAQELAVEGVEHTITVSGGHSLMFFTSPTVIVYELILDDAVFGILDAENVLG